ncbi:metal-dependent hydrolase [Paenibacillus sambharensis]|uniref:Metal-dependent hydrolase n=1 Tax=Paenibacillus sambharensis TaxID=1803190 RepID=A0A2W1L2T9_9BACL|nr:metal-dependent hydrolase [Paenibacillus sambharensis]PZD93656.1 metal-dependent hydrolase [Paenibacillus sambharensis]
MDTSSHLLFGITLAGLAMIDPVIAGTDGAAAAMIAASLVGNNAPDFDGVMRVKGKAAYLRNHRGWTHALPVLPLWALVIGLPAAYLAGAEAAAWHIVGWTLAAVCLHVLLDLLNAYGVQCLRPMTKKWLHLDVISLFDPFLFSLHSAGALLWAAGFMEPGPMFAVIYGLSIGYVILKFHFKHQAVSLLKKQGIPTDGLTMIPGLFGRYWQFASENHEDFKLGTIQGSKVIVEAELPKQEPGHQLHPVIQATMSTDGVRSFLSFADRYQVEWKEREEGYEVTWSDIRFWYNHKMPFRAAVRLDRNLNVMDERIGWYKKSWEPPHV